VVDDSSRARQAILERVRAANGRASDVPDATQAWQQLPRTYRSASSRPPDEVLNLLVDRLRDYDAEVEQASPADARAAVERVLAERHHPRMLVAAGTPLEFLDFPNCTTDTGFSPTELDSFEGVLTEATLAIAETGTLVLQNVPGQGRRAATLVPDFHLCLLRIADVVETVPEAFRRLAQTATLPTTFISGPSATADIEMTRIKGVHGPRFLYVMLVG
jgi:L-lactate dehydrogenase complex protein LldG